jgi:tetratricopeptide (TPR) repeat protein
VAEGIEVPQDKAWALEEIAAGLMRAEENEQAKEVLEDALKVAEEIWQPVINERLRGIAEKMAQVGQIDQALKVVRRIGWRSHKALALKEIAAVLTQTGKKERAKKVLGHASEAAGRIELAESKAEVLAEIAAGLAQAEERAEAKEVLEQALKSVREIEDARHKALTLMKITKKLARLGWEQEAVKVAEAIPTERVPEIAEAAEAIVEVGDKENFKRLSLIPCAYYLDAAYKMCGLLARLYPEQATAVAEVVHGKMS